MHQARTGVTLLVNGKPIDDEQIPSEALPDCQKCEKPELDPSSFEGLLLYNDAGHAQDRNDWSGHRLGMRPEAAMVCLEMLVFEGRITDPTTAWRRAKLIDRVANRMMNGKAGQNG